MDGCDHWDTRGAGGFGRAWIEGRGGWSQFFGAQNSKSETLEEAKESASSIAKDLSSDALSEEGSKTSQQHEREQEQARFAGTLEWIANKVPTQSAASALSALSATLSLSEPRLERAQQQAANSSTKPKFDLELFYIALARNLYEAGL